MARWRQCGGMSLLLLLVAIFWARADGACYQDVLDGDGFSSLPASGGNYDPSTITLTICSSICVDTGGLEAAVENGLVCLCGTGGQLTGLSPSTCPTNCPTDNAECGGPDGLITGETAPLKSGPIVLTPVTSPVTTADVVQAAGSTIATVTEFIVSPGDGSPPFVLTGTPAAAGTDFSTSLDYLAPGTYMLSVMSPSAASSTQVTVQGLPMLVRVDCPPLVQPTELYSCTAGVGGSNLQLTATFSDDSISMAMTPPETPWQRVGHPPPHGTAQAPVQVTPAELVFTLSQPFTQRTQLLALHWHGAGAGDCQLTLMEGSCSDASQAFCPSSGQCAAHCPLVTGTSNYTCDVSEPVFCPFAGQCSMSDGTCAARAAPILSATSVAAVDFTTATDAYGKLLLADSNTWAEPGWFAKVTCTTGGAVSWITVPADQGDMGDTSTDKQYMIELLGLPQTPIGIPHTCAGMSDITLTVSDGSATITNTTACQIPVGLITVEVEQKGALVPAEAAPPPSDNFSGAFFAEANVDITFKVTIQKGAPVLLEYSFDESSSGVANHSEDIQRPVVPSEVFTHTVRFTSSGTFTVRVTGTNKHSVPEQPEYSELTVTVQHPVTVDWLPALDTAASKFLVTVVGTKEPATVVFEMRLPSADQLPTDASMTINFDDGYTKDELLLSDGSIGLADNTPTSAAVNGFFVAGFNHGFERRGNFSVQITMKNRISEESDTIEVMVEEKIIGLEAPVRQNLDDRKDELLDGLGKDENEYRNDRNLTFSFNLLQGSMTMVKLFNDSNGEHVLLETFTFIDKDNPTDEIFVYHIDTNQELTLSFVGVNTYEETEPVPAVVIIQDPITEITRLILALDEEQPEDYMMKKFTASWTSASTMQMCLAIHFGDASPLVTYGDEVMCETKYPKAVNMPALLENPMPFEFQYWVKGVYNVSINVLNPKDDESYELLVSVSNVACSNPIVSIIGASEAREEPPTYLMSQNIVIEAHAELNCDASMTTKKRWEIIHIVTDDAESAHIMHQLNHWDKADLVVPRNFLNPGLYMLLYTMTMQDQGIEDGDIFQTQTKAYIEIERTPLHAGFIMGAVSKIVRGWNQPIVLDGVTHSYDPDDMSSKEFTFQWYCRRLGDERADALNATTPPQSLTGRQAAAPVPDPDLGGCFGEGPGRLDLDGGWLEINTEFLQPYQQAAVTYIITVVVGKDDRRSMAEVQVAMSEGSPPLIEVQCADVVLCSPSLEGVTVNPQHILGLRGGCFDGECPVPLDWAWSLSTVNDDSEVTAIENTEQYLPTPNAQEVRISNTLFSDFPDVKFLIVLEASDNAEGNPPGKAMYFVTVNKPPEVDGKLCTCSPITGRALLDDFSIKCQNPVDPEGFPVESFQFFTTVAGKTEQLAVKKIPELTIRLPLGINQLQYIAEDRQGASARKDVCAPIDATQPSAEELQAFLDSKDVLSLAGTGDARSAIPIILAVASLQNTAEKDAMPPEERLLAEVKDAAYRDNMFKTVENMAATSKEAIALKSVALNALMSAGSGRPQSIDMSTNKNALNVIESLSEAVGDAGFATVESMVVVLDSILRTASVIHENLAYTTSSESCEEIPLADLNKAPLMPVDNAIDYSKKPEILSREKELKCSVRDAARREAKDLDDRLTRALERAQKATMQRMVLEQSVEFETPRGGATRMSIKKGLGGNNETVGEAAIAWPSNMTINDGKPVAVSVSDTAVNSKTTVEGAGTISTTSRLLSVNIFRRNLEPLKIANVSEGILMKISQTYRNTSNGSCTDCPLPPSKINSTEALKGKLLAVVYSMINITKPHSAFNIEFTAYDGPVNDVFVMISFGHMPTLRNHSLLKMVTDFPYEESPEPDDIDATEKYRWFVSSDWVDNREGAVYVGIGQFNSSSAKYNDTMAIVNGGGDFSKFKSKEILGKEFTVKMYKLQTYTSSCAFYDEEMSMWTSEGLQVIESDLHSVTCNSSHLTSFASGLFVQPNTIDFAYVFANASFTDNLTIYMTLIILLVMYLLLLIWARWQDKKDVEKLGALPLPDNKTNSKYLYEIMLFTGHKADAATDSNVSFVLTGDDYDSGTRTFGKPKRQFFRKGGQDAFVMAVPGYLGDLKYLRIWHDNSGKGRFASWFLQYVLVRNIQTGEMTTFVCNEWLAVEYDDGLIDRLIPVAGKEQMRDFATVFPHTSQQSLSDGHLWFSVFLRPPRSRFTRMQRVSCCFALLFLSMMVNAMWYDRVPSQATAGAIKLGPLSLSPEEIAVGVMSNIIVFVPSLLIVFLFRKSRPRKLRESRIDTAMQKGRGEESKQASASGGEDAGDVTQDIGSESRKASLASSIKSGSSSKQKKAKKRRFTLPWWGVIIGWILCILCLFGSAFIVYAYGITFGNEKATKWVTSLFISLFSSILLIQPLKVFVSALVISAIFKNVDLGSDDANEDEQDPQLSSDEEWFMGSSGKTHASVGSSSPYDKETLETIRKQRIKEIEMGVIVREILSYSFFLWILVVLSFDNRDPNAFYLQKNMENAFIKVGDNTGFTTWLDFSKVSNTSAFWYWSQNVIMQELRAQTWYDGITPALGLRGFLDDRVNRIVGRATMRQIRSLPNTCTIHGAMRSLIGSCQGYTSIVSEDTNSYCANWTERGSRVDCSRVEYRYSSASNLQNLPVVAKQDVYGGGGFVFQLSGAQNKLLKQMARLEKENWIDSLTRAVFIEFSVYNAQVNLFGVATIYVELTPGGGMNPLWRFDGVRLTKQAGSQAFVIICEILYVLFIIYFIVREVRLIRKQKKEYLKQYSSYAEWVIILLSFTGLIVYIMRFIETDSILATFKETYGNGYVKLTYAQLLDDLYGYIVGIIVFIATLKFIKLLRFNRRIGMLSATLKQTWNDLTGFLVIFTIAIGSFGLLFNLLLVASMNEFKDWLSAVESCFAMMLNKFEFMEMYRGSFLASIMFFLFAIYMNLIFVNVLLTIILKGFEQVKNDVTKQPNDYEVVDFVMRRFKKFIGINAVTPLRDVVAEHQREQEESKNVRQLPDKVSTFIDQINHTYFDGKLDLNDKKQLKKTLRQAKHEQRGRPKSMEGFQRDEEHMTKDQQLLDQL